MRGAVQTTLGRVLQVPAAQGPQSGHRLPRVRPPLLLPSPIRGMGHPHWSSSGFEVPVREMPLL